MLKNIQLVFSEEKSTLPGSYYESTVCETSTIGITGDFTCCSNTLIGPEGRNFGLQKVLKMTLLSNEI